MKMSIEKDLIIAEKDSQSEAIAEALGMVEKSISIKVESSESEKLKTILVKIEKKKDRVEKKRTEIKDLIDAGKESTKKFSSATEKLAEYLNALNDLEGEYEKQKESYDRGASFKSVNYWENDTAILVSATGHLIDLKLATGSTEALRFDFDYDLPFPDDKNPNKTFKWLKLQAISHFLSKMKVKRYICATDYDREGQSIFATIMEYYKIPLVDCLRMKFSTLEDYVLKDAFEHLIPFDTNLYNAGKARRWMDFAIGYNLNPIFSSIYREYMNAYLDELGIDDKNNRNRIKYAFTTHLGRVKLVILNHLSQHTREQIEKAFLIEKHEPELDEEEIYESNFVDNDGNKVELSCADKIITEFDKEREIRIGIISVSEHESSAGFPYYDPIKIPTFLNLTTVFQICEKFGASTKDIDSIIQFLYQKKYISYPRSKSQRWEKETDKEKMDYSRSVLEALKKIGYIVKDYYFDGYGNEGAETHSHPCIHPLPSVTLERINQLKSNPLAYLVFNEISLYTLKCFEKQPVTIKQKVEYVITQEDSESIIAGDIERTVEVKQPNIIDLIGISTYSKDLQNRLKVKEDDEFTVKTDKFIKKKYTIEPSVNELQFLTDFDVLNFLNENDIGTEATRAHLLSQLVEEQYVSDNVLFTTFIGDIMKRLGDIVEFIDIDYTIEIEKELNKVETGTMSFDAFIDNIKELITITINRIIEKKENVIEVLSSAPVCEIHKIKMVLLKGTYGKFYACPHSFMAGCKQVMSIQ